MQRIASAVKTTCLHAFVIVVAAISLMSGAHAQSANGTQYTMQEIVDAGHGFFGSTSGGLAKVVERAFQNYGLPNGYILGQEGSGAFVAGLTYGEGDLYTKNAGQHDVFWQGPSLGIDWGGQGSRATHGHVDPVVDPRGRLELPVEVVEPDDRDRPVRRRALDYVEQDPPLAVLRLRDAQDEGQGRRHPPLQV